MTLYYGVYYAISLYLDFQLEPNGGLVTDKHIKMKLIN